MAILLKDIWQIDNPSDYKAHFARWNGYSQPLEVFVRDRAEWKGWQEYWPGRDEFNRPYIFSLIQFYHETDAWLFGGVYRVLARQEDRYEVELENIGSEFIGRLKLHSPYRGRTTRPRFESHYDELQVLEILRQPYTGRKFPGYDEIELSFEELETVVKNDRPEWKAPLENVKGVYLITDAGTRRQYVGAAYGDQGVWSRWAGYVASGHGGNVELQSLLRERNTDYCRANFRFALLETHSNRTPDETIFHREAFWKRILLSRGEDGLNRN